MAEEQELFNKIFALSNKIGEWTIVWGALEKGNYEFGCYFDKEISVYKIYINYEKGRHRVRLSTPNEKEALEKLYSMVKFQAELCNKYDEGKKE